MAFLGLAKAKKVYRCFHKETSIAGRSKEALVFRLMNIF